MATCKQTATGWGEEATEEGKGEATIRSDWEAAAISGVDWTLMA